MTRPTWIEVMAAVGYSLGRVSLWARKLKRPITLAVFLAAAFFLIRYSLPRFVVLMAELPPVNTSVIVALFAAGFLFFGAASFAYVLFAFLSRLCQSDAGIRRDFQSIIAKAAHPLQTVGIAAPAASDGSFTPYSDDRAYLQEQFDALVAAKILSPEDNLDDMLKSGDFDFETIRDRAVGG